MDEPALPYEYVVRAMKDRERAVALVNWKEMHGSFSYGMCREWVWFNAWFCAWIDYFDSQWQGLWRD